MYMHTHSRSLPDMKILSHFASPPMGTGSVTHTFNMNVCLHSRSLPEVKILSDFASPPTGAGSRRYSGGDDHTWQVGVCVFLRVPPRVLDRGCVCVCVCVCVMCMRVYVCMHACKVLSGLTIVAGVYA